MVGAVAFYERAGFGVRIYIDDSGDSGDAFAFVDYDGRSVFDLDAATALGAAPRLHKPCKVGKAHVDRPRPIRRPCSPSAA